MNGEPKTVSAYPMERLLDVLRVQLGLTGTKEGCGEGECGACSVLMDGALVDSCLVPVLQAQGANVVTIEGLGSDARALRAAGRVSGIRRRAVRHLHAGNDSRGVYLLQHKPEPTMDDIREGLAGNLCRCTGYAQIFEAVAAAARARSCAMRSDPAEYDLVAPANLQAAVSLLASEPDRWLPIAGGTDVMVQYAAGTLRARKLVSIWNLPELRRIEAFCRAKSRLARAARTPICANTKWSRANFRSWRARQAGPAESRTRIEARSAAIS